MGCYVEVVPPAQNIFVPFPPAHGGASGGGYGDVYCSFAADPFGQEVVVRATVKAVGGDTAWYGPPGNAGAFEGAAKIIVPAGRRYFFKAQPRDEGVSVGNRSNVNVSVFVEWARPGG